MTIKTTTSLAVLIKPTRASAPHARARSRQAAIDELEEELARTKRRGDSPKLEKLLTGELAIQKGALRKRERLAKQYRDPAWADPNHGLPRPRVSLGGLLKTEPERSTMSTKPTTASPSRVSLAKLKLKAPDAPVTDANGEKHEVAGLIKGLHKSGGVSLHLPQALRKGGKK